MCDHLTRYRFCGIRTFKIYRLIYRGGKEEGVSLKNYSALVHTTYHKHGQNDQNGTERGQRQVTEKCEVWLKSAAG